MTPVRPVYTFRIDEDLLAHMETLKERDGIPYSEQVRRGLKLFFESRGLAVKKAERKRAVTRKRS